MFVDDFACLGGDHEVDAWAIRAMGQLDSTNFPVSISKALKQGAPAPVFEYLGLTYDLIKHEVRCPKDKATDVLRRLHEALTTKGMLLSSFETLVGKLSFLSGALYGMRGALRPLYDAKGWALHK